jgi:hypothetical protein
VSLELRLASCYLLLATCDLQVAPSELCAKRAAFCVLTLYRVKARDAQPQNALLKASTI